MALSVQDAIIQYAGGTVLGSGAAATNWRPVVGRSQPTVTNPGPNYMSRSAHSTDGNSSVVWRPDTFNADHAAEISHDPTFWTGAGTIRNVGPAVRMSSGSDTCYAMYVTYMKNPGGSVSADGVSYGYLWQEVVRVNAGVVTSLGTFLVPGWTWADDWWFGTLEVWGQNPVRLRVINKAPLEYVLGTDNAGAAPGAIGQLPAAADYVIGGVTYNSEDWRMDGGASIAHAPDAFSIPPTSGALAWDAVNARMNSGRAWVVWEGSDASPDRILSGQPGIRWGGANYFDAVKFSAYEIADRLTARVISQAGGSAVIGGYRKPGAVVTVT